MRLAVIPGDGIGPEVVTEALKVLAEVAPGTEITNYDLGAARWHSTGELLPESVLGELREQDAILLGEADINIEAAQISQTTDGTDAVMLLRVDRTVEPDVLGPIGAGVGASTVRAVTFPQ